MPQVDASPALFSPSDRAFLRAVSQLAYTNPFHPDRALAERAALGDELSGAPEANTRRLAARLRPLLTSAAEQLARGAPASDEDLGLHHDASFQLLYSAHEACLQQIIDKSISSLAGPYQSFAAEHARLRCPDPPEDVFAACLQVRRAHHYIGGTLVGASRPVCELRRRVWESIFTVDMREGLQSPDAAMDEIPVLVTGPSGTGKDLVARAIGHCRRVPFDSHTMRLVSDPEKDFRILHLMGQPEALLESALFGHKRGAFTGAVADHAGWFETGGPFATLFLDEVGELTKTIQVKLLVVLENRIFQRVGGQEDLLLRGRLVSATNRDLATLVAQGEFRLDLYHRLCAVVIPTPSLRAQLDDMPGERRRLIRFIAGKLRPGMPDKAEALTDKVEAWLDLHLAHYAWPGNVRELGRCVRSVMTVGDYRPASLEEAPPSDPLRPIREGTASEKRILEICTTLVQARTHDVGETARVLGVHRNTVTRRIDTKLLAKLLDGSPGSARPRGRGRPRRRE